MLIVSLASIPPRYESCLNNICNFWNTQIVKPDIMILNICHNYRRFKNIDLIITDEINELIKKEKLIINYASDMGSLTKIYPTIQYINKTFNFNKNIDIITIDDDCKYTDNLIKLLMDKAKSTNREKVIGFFGFNFNDKYNIVECVTHVEMTKKNINEQECHIIGGVNGCYYNREMFDEFFDKYVENLDFSDYLCDDELLGVYSLKLEIKKIAINYNTFKSIDQSAYDDYALHKNNVNERQEKTLKNCSELMDKLLLEER